MLWRKLLFVAGTSRCRLLFVAGTLRASGQALTPVSMAAHRSFRHEVCKLEKHRARHLRLGKEDMDCNAWSNMRRQNPQRVGAPGKPAKKRHQYRKIRTEHHGGTDAQAEPRKNGRAKRATKIAHPQRVLHGKDSSGVKEHTEETRTQMLHAYIDCGIPACKKRTPFH